MTKRPTNLTKLPNAADAAAAKPSMRCVITFQHEFTNCAFICKACGSVPSPCEHIKQMFSGKIENQVITYDPATGKGAMV